MRIALALDDNLLADAQEHTGTEEKSALVEPRAEAAGRVRSRHPRQPPHFRSFGRGRFERWQSFQRASKPVQSKVDSGSSPG